MSLRPSGALAAALLLALGPAACGGGSQPQEPAPAAESAAPIEAVDPATAATITGRIAFAGTVPASRPVRMASDPKCPQDGPAPAEAVVVHDGALQNVFVYVKDGLGGRRFATPTAPVVLDQQGCRYVPHVLGIQVGQPLEIVNGDATLHNVHALARANREFNMGQPTQGMTHTHTFSAAEVMVPFKCDVHGWMRAWVGVLPHPYYAVSAADGTFTIAGLPPGTYTIEAWHETLGTQTQTVTVGASETTTLPFSFAAPEKAS